jgi:hypothetical protein
VTEAAEQVASSLRQQQAAAAAAAQAAVDKFKPPAGAPARRSSRAAAKSAAHKLAAAANSGKGPPLVHVLLQHALRARSSVHGDASSVCNGCAGEAVVNDVHGSCYKRSSLWTAELDSLLGIVQQ